MLSANSHKHDHTTAEMDKHNQMLGMRVIIHDASRFSWEFTCEHVGIELLLVYVPHILEAVYIYTQIIIFLLSITSEGTHAIKIYKFHIYQKEKNLAEKCLLICGHGISLKPLHRNEGVGVVPQMKNNNLQTFISH
ncbi:hypothetical protein ACJX0J_019076 [Zea mays]